MKFHFVTRNSKEAASGDSKELPCWMKPEAFTNYSNPIDSLVPEWNGQEVPVTRKFKPTASGEHGLQTQPQPRWNLELGVGKKVIPKRKSMNILREAGVRCPFGRITPLLRGMRMTETQQLIAVINFCQWLHICVWHSWFLLMELRLLQDFSYDLLVVYWVADSTKGSPTCYSKVTHTTFLI